MDSLFKPSGCSQESSQNPIPKALDSLLSGPEFQPSQFQEANELEDAWEYAEAQIQTQPQFESAWEEANFEKAWEDSACMGSVTPEELTYIWQNMWPNEQPIQYLLHPENPYLNDLQAFEKGFEFLEQGEVYSGIQAFEAAVMQNQGNAEAWKMLGLLCQELDEDARAIAAFTNGHEADPYNLDILLHLGVSLINEKDETQALEFLKSWIFNNPEYSSCAFESEDLREEVLSLFMQAQMVNPNDPDVHLALGVLYFAIKDFDQAVDCFSKALLIKPDDHYLLNKLGAAYANCGKSELALEVYPRAVELRPSYVRAWVNIGVAYANLGDFYTAARFYLQALSLNPNPPQVWNYLFTAFTCLRRFDLIKKLLLFDPAVFSDEFSVNGKCNN